MLDEYAPSGVTVDLHGLHAPCSTAAYGSGCTRSHLEVPVYTHVCAYIGVFEGAACACSDEKPMSTSAAAAAPSRH